LNTSKEDEDQNTSKEDRNQSHRTEVKSQRKNTESIWGQRFLRKKSNGQNSPWRTHEVVGAIGCCRVARWLEASETHHLRIQDQHEPLDHIANSGFVSLEARPKFMFCTKF
jgi:hypothetical protein